MEYQRTLQDETLQLMLTSQKDDCTIPWGGSMHIAADLANSGNGIGCIGFSASGTMCEGKIKQWDLLYTVVCAVSPRLQKSTWNRVAGWYISSMLTNPRPSASLCEMPDVSPWVAGLAGHAAIYLSENGKSRMMAHVRAAAAALVRRCMNVYVEKLDESALKEPGAGESDLLG